MKNLLADTTQLVAPLLPWWEREIANTAITALAFVVTAFIAIWTFRANTRVAHHTELDKMYLDILRLKFEMRAKPETSSANMGTTSDPTGPLASAGDAYAVIVWSFLETLYFRCYSDHSLYKIWQPVIREETREHAATFEKLKENNWLTEEFVAWVYSGTPSYSKLDRSAIWIGSFSSLWRTKIKHDVDRLQRHALAAEQGARSASYHSARAREIAIAVRKLAASNNKSSRPEATLPLAEAAEERARVEELKALHDGLQALQFPARTRNVS